jgi:putative flippase GtrA
MWRYAKFNAVGLAGLIVQLAALEALYRIARVDYLTATALAVEIAVLHNFWWHWKWTWAGRGVGPASLLRFQLTTGVVSILGNLLGMKLFAGLLEMPLLAASLASAALLHLFNYFTADRYVFRLR